MPHFPALPSDDDLKEIIKSAFDSDLPVDGSWGYTQASATKIEASDIPLPQIEHIFASMRAYTEMNMTREPQDRYGSINLNELSRETIEDSRHTYDKVTYEITAMKESIYTEFIKEYKEEYGKTTFDLNAHFKRRKEATLHREVTHWFSLS